MPVNFREFDFIIRRPAHFKISDNHYQMKVTEPGLKNICCCLQESDGLNITAMGMKMFQ
jgi:hypothetical protein